MSQFLQILPMTGIVSLFYLNHSSACVVISPCDFNLHFTVINDGDHHVLICQISSLVKFSIFLVFISQYINWGNSTRKQLKRWAKDLNRHLRIKYWQLLYIWQRSYIDGKYMKKHSSPYTIRELQVKTRRHHYTPIGRMKMQNPDNSKSWQGYGAKEVSFIAGGKAKRGTHFERQFSNSL